MLLFYHYLFIEKKKVLSAYSQYPCDLLQYNFYRVKPVLSGHPLLIIKRIEDRNALYKNLYY